MYRKSIIFIVRLNFKMNYGRSLKIIHFYERFDRGEFKDIGDFEDTWSPWSRRSKCGRRSS